MTAAGTASFADRVAKRLGIDPGRLAGTGPAGAATLADVLKKAGRKAPAAALSSPDGFIGDAEAGGEESGGERHRLEAVCDAAPLRRTCQAFAAVTSEPPGVFAIVVRLCGAALRDVPALSRSSVRLEGDPEPNAPAAAGPPAAVPGRTPAANAAGNAGVRAVRGAMRTAGGPGETSRPPPRSASGPAGRGAGRVGGEGGDEPGPAPEFVVRAPAAREPSSLPGRARETNEAGGRVVLTIGEEAGSVHLGLEFDARTVPAAAGEAFLERLRTLCLDPRRALL